MAFKCICGEVVISADQCRQHMRDDADWAVERFGMICPGSGELCSDTACFRYDREARAACKLDAIAASSVVKKATTHG